MSREGWIRRHICQDEILPKWWGFAYTEPHRLGAICYPIPLNIVVGLWHHLYMWLQLGLSGWHTQQEKDCLRCYRAGEEHDRNIERMLKQKHHGLN